MPYIKQQKSKAYFKRFQTKFRRRREGKTDFKARRGLITQDKNKYNCPKFRLVVRFSSKFVKAQIIKATIKGDETICEANSKELAKHGLEVGLKNYPACYATGLLCARRLLTTMGLDEIYPGNEEVSGEVVSTEMNGKTYFVEEINDEKRPFRALLDVGIKATTTGSRVFAVMKGATDGGLDVPHNERRFPGYDREGKEFDAETHKGRIMGEHIAEYMREMEEDDEENYKKHFADYIKADLDADDLEDLYEKVHSSIRENPEREVATPFAGADKKYKRPIKLTYDQRKARVAEKKAALQAGDESSDEDEDSD